MGTIQPIIRVESWRAELVRNFVHLEAQPPATAARTSILLEPDEARQMFAALAEVVAVLDAPTEPPVVPPALRPWDVPFSAYRPVDVTPPELQRDGLAASVAEGWAEPYVTPAEMPNWSHRQAVAIVPFELDARGWPLNPTGRTGRTGRNLGKWGENQAADPIVIAGNGEQRRVLLIRRGDVGEWAIPGGMVDPGETAPQALVRELREETSLDLTEITPTVLDRVYVDDWRTSDHAWITSTVALYQIPGEIPAVAGDDAADAAWWPLHDLDQLAADLEPAGGLYEPHRPLLHAALSHLATKQGGNR